MIEKISKIYMPKKMYDSIINHCVRKYNRNFFSNETKEQQAYGLIGGKLSKEVLVLKEYVELRNNNRNSDAFNEFMNKAIKELSIPSEVLVEERAWVANPREVKNSMEFFEENECELVGAYHMHSDISWKGDYDKELPSNLDRLLAKKSKNIMFIVRIRESNKNGIRAFFEGDLEKEIPINIEKELI